MDTTMTARIPSSDIIDMGFLCAAFAWTIWWNLDWQRFIKFYIRGGPPYRRSVEIGFRTFFAACSVDAAIGLVEQLFQHGWALVFYERALRVAAAYFVVIVLLVKTVEWVNKKRMPKAPDPK